MFRSTHLLVDSIIVILFKCNRHKLSDYRPRVFGKLRNYNHALYVELHCIIKTPSNVMLFL